MGDKPRNTLAAERRKARHYGMQALYQWYMAQAPLTDIEAEFRATNDAELLWWLHYVQHEPASTASVLSRGACIGMRASQPSSSSSSSRAETSRPEAPPAPEYAGPPPPPNM